MREDVQMQDIPVIGTHIPWSQTDGCILVASDWTSLSSEVDGKVQGPPGLALRLRPRPIGL